MAKSEKNGDNKTAAIEKFVTDNPGSTAKQIVDGLSKEGVKVSISLVNQRRPDRGTKKGRKGKPGRKPGRKPASAKARGRSADGVNKSQAIREEYGRVGLKTAPAAVIRALAAKGITVVSAQVSTIRKKLRKAARLEKKLGKAPPAAVASASGMIAVDHLVKAKQLVAEIGGIDAARKALEALAQLK